MKEQLDQLKDNYETLRNDYNIAQARINKNDEDLAGKTKEINNLKNMTKTLEDSLNEKEKIISGGI